MALSTAQVQILRTALLANVDATFVSYRNAGATGAMADWYNTAGAKIAWKTNVSVGTVGDNVVGTELAGLTSLNITRLQCILQMSPSGVNPSLSDRRAFFDDVFSGAGGALTRAKLLALWKRPMTRGEEVFATGTGTDASPALLGFEGSITNEDVVRAFYNNA